MIHLFLHLEFDGGERAPPVSHHCVIDVKNLSRRREIRLDRRTDSSDTFCPHATVVRFGHVTNDRQTETSAALLASSARICTIKSLEDPWQVVWMDAFAGVSDADPDSIGIGLRENAHRSRRSVAEPILHEVGEDLAEGGAISKGAIRTLRD